MATGRTHQDFARQVLEALVSGYLAREGLKDRFRSLNEYEIARRVGITGYSYAQFDSCRERLELREALELLEQQGLVSQGSTSGRYVTFAPTASATAAVAATAADPAASSTSDQPRDEPRDGAVFMDETAEIEGAPTVAVARLERKLDEVIQLLRSIERSLTREREQPTED